MRQDALRTSDYYFHTLCGAIDAIRGVINFSVLGDGLLSHDRVQGLNGEGNTSSEPHRHESTNSTDSSQSGTESCHMGSIPLLVPAVSELSYAFILTLLLIKKMCVESSPRCKDGLFFAAFDDKTVIRAFTGILSLVGGLLILSDLDYVEGNQDAEAGVILAAISIGLSRSLTALFSPERDVHANEANDRENYQHLA